MKQVTTILCCLAFAIAGICLAISENNDVTWKHQTINAATLPASQVSMLPLDVQLDLGKEVQTNPTIIRDTDTVYIDRPQILVINKKSSKVSTPKKVTDVAWMMLKPGCMSKDTVSNKDTPVREEKAGECDVGSSKETAIQLTVDGKIVYSKNVNHSTGESQ